MDFVRGFFFVWLPIHFQRFVSTETFVPVFPTGADVRPMELIREATLLPSARSSGYRKSVKRSNKVFIRNIQTKLRRGYL